MTEAENKNRELEKRIAVLEARLTNMENAPRQPANNLGRTVLAIVLGILLFLVVIGVVQFVSTG
ncbi:hypothetical protein HQN87_03810 [Paenibacillus tritici]|uniref:Uncharacterized protein n=1 Tax=Paenibacillus tritici TaxID=1873425 RepID=A0ABX2DK39_9BACL|nr:hypothetical protein [Paenibacillus tritici]NQX44449.1 hypothetical protein [Paenibacillus tritici]QUL53530.1 hypothetical protein KDC22_24600 [Paenibacillus tritici]